MKSIRLKNSSRGPAGIRAALAAGCGLLGLAPVLHSAEIIIRPDETESKDTFAYSFAGAPPWVPDLRPFNFDTESETPPGDSYGDWLSAGTTASHAHDTVTFITFDYSELSGIDPDDITSVVLRLNVVNPATTIGHGTYPSVSYPITLETYFIDEVGEGDANLWLEHGIVVNNVVTDDGLNWFNQPAFSTPAAADEIVTGLGTVEIDVTAAVIAHLDSTVDNNGFAIAQESAVENGEEVEVVGVFDSAAASTAANRPTLVVTYDE
ncbi:MAG: DNRLRE domain-containing protein [Verrucomicrobiota bacterium]